VHRIVLVALAALLVAAPTLAQTSTPTGMGKLTPEQKAAAKAKLADKKALAQTRAANAKAKATEKKAAMSAP